MEEGCLERQLGFVEDGWSTAVFRKAFEASLGVTILLILLYPVLLAMETRRKKTTKHVIRHVRSEKIH
ncbi:hypothetical protein PAT3040_00498 [Paenibacillus agaridevorans]|uniref:Uncharacterized protein n=1 Tax=Paenibacillus agaridevorans TaxID=171404 RepID=A0A2R5EHM5_9BACL|nr:hypothetical protein PAT3040_00498 [Paenibacillus agaridevorans]